MSGWFDATGRVVDPDSFSVGSSGGSVSIGCRHCAVDYVKRQFGSAQTSPELWLCEPCPARQTSAGRLATRCNCQAAYTTDPNAVMVDRNARCTVCASGYYAPSDGLTAEHL